MLGKNKEVQASQDASTRPAASNVVVGTSTIGKEMTIDGTCHTEGSLKIEGAVNGDVAANGVDIARDGTVEGDVMASPSAKSMVVRVGGRVTGRVRAGSVLVLEGGVVLGGIEADEATVQGRVEGGLMTRGRLTITKTAVIVGEVRTERLMMEEGGQVNGTIHMGKQAPAVSADRKETAAA